MLIKEILVFETWLNKNSLRSLLSNSPVDSESPWERFHYFFNVTFLLGILALRNFL